MNKIDIARKVASEHQYHEFKCEKHGKNILDGQSANLIVKIYEHLTPERQERFTKKCLCDMANLSWCLVKKQKGD